jgi:hypothetical protein
MHVPGVEPYLDARELNPNALLVFAAIMGFEGARIPLAIARWTVKPAAFGICGGRTEGIRRRFMTHPPLEERIAALQAPGEH